jgi:transcriptional regulator with GAF, ATPase, and Fis domain
MESCIKTVRQVLGDTGRAQRLVQTLHGYGYRFVATVDRDPDGIAEVSRLARPTEAAGLPVPQAAPAPTLPPALRKLLDKPKTLHLLQTFVEHTPEVSACWVAGRDGACVVGYPDCTAPDVQALVETVAQTQEAMSQALHGVAPILVSNTCGGAVVAQYSRPPVGTDNLGALHLLGAALSQLAMSGFERREILLDALDTYRELSLLYAITETIGAALSIEQIAQVVLETSRKIIRTENGSIMLLHPDTEALEILVAYGVKQPRQVSLKKGVGIAGLVAQTGIPEIVNDTYADARFVHYTGGVRSLLCVPLKIQETMLGVMNVSHPLTGRMFTARDAKFLMTLASQAAIAMENARLVTALHEKNQVLERTMQQWHTSAGG